MSDPNKKASGHRRVYEYVDGDGNVYYSFYKAPSLLSPPTRLKLRDRVGTHLIRFLVGLRRESEAMDEEGSPGRVPTPSME